MGGDEPVGGAAVSGRSPAGRPWSSPARVAFADAVRRLVVASVTSLAGDEDLARAAGALGDLAARLTPSPGAGPGGAPADPGRAGDGHAPRFDADVEIEDGEAMTAAMPFDVVVGTCNPLAPPLSLRFEPPLALASVTFGPAHEGAPGCVHGAVIAGAFDVVLTAANVVAGAAGPTVDLAVHYLRPTLVGVEAELAARAVEIGPRRITSTGTLTQDGLVRVEATGTFAVFDRDRILAHHRGELGRSGEGGVAGGTPAA